MAAIRIKLADHVFEIDNKYPYIERLSENYKTDEPAQVTFAVSAAERERENQSEENYSDGYLEGLAVYRKICEWLLDKDVLLFHCSAVMLDGKAYLFTAPSGTGKSTHARLWRKQFGSRVTMINDDKPLLAVRHDGITVYGTPFGGKDNIQTNTSCQAAGIVVLHQAEENEIHPLTAREAYPMLLNQTYRRKDSAGMIKTLDLVQRLTELPVYALGCNISGAAVQMAYEALTGKDIQ